MKDGILSLIRRVASAGLVAQAMLMLVLARLAIAVFSFARLAQWLGAFVPPSADAEQPSVHPRAARRIARALAAGAQRLPFAPTCLTSALAGVMLCRFWSIACVLHMGAARGQGDGAETHAWLEAGGIPISGYPLPAEMVELGRFIRRVDRPAAPPR